MLARGARRGNLVVISLFPCLEQHWAEDDQDDHEDDEPLAHELWQRHALGEFLEPVGNPRADPQWHRAFFIGYGLQDKLSATPERHQRRHPWQPSPPTPNPLRKAPSVFLDTD